MLADALLHAPPILLLWCGVISAVVAGVVAGAVAQHTARRQVRRSLRGASELVDELRVLIAILRGHP